MTTDRTALLRSILERPECDTARFVFADYLEENPGTLRCPLCTAPDFVRVPLDKWCGRCKGSLVVTNGDAELAEFIRLQVRMSEIRRGCGCGACVKLRGGGQHHNGPCGIDQERIEKPDGTSRQAYLRIAEQELFMANHAVWFPEIKSTVTLVAPNERERKAGGRFHVVRRGFVSSIHCTLADWIGIPCRRCDGTGFIRYYHPVEIEGLDDCEECPGIRRTPMPGCPMFGPHIVAKHPIERVELNDKRPLDSNRSQGFRWIRDGEDCFNLPGVIFDLLPTGPTCTMVRDAGGWNSMFSIRDYESLPAAMDAASYALLAWARIMAELPTEFDLSPARTI